MLFFLINLIDYENVTLELINGDSLITSFCYTLLFTKSQPRLRANVMCLLQNIIMIHVLYNISKFGWI